MLNLCLGLYFFIFLSFHISFWCLFLSLQMLKHVQVSPHRSSSSLGRRTSDGCLPSHGSPSIRSPSTCNKHNLSSSSSLGHSRSYSNKHLNRSTNPECPSPKISNGGCNSPKILIGEFSSPKISTCGGCTNPKRVNKSSSVKLSAPPIQTSPQLCETSSTSSTTGSFSTSSNCGSSTCGSSGCGNGRCYRSGIEDFGGSLNERRIRRLRRRKKSRRRHDGEDNLSLASSMSCSSEDEPDDFENNVDEEDELNLTFSSRGSSSVSLHQKVWIILRMILRYIILIIFKYCLIIYDFLI